MQRKTVPFFSVIIPAYNAANFIRCTLKSVYRQSFSNFEVIVVDDGSTDNTSEILEKETDTRLKVIRQKNSGVSAARNRGIQEAEGTYIAFLDSDDAWTQDHLELAARFFNKYPEYTWYFSTLKRVATIHSIDYTPSTNSNTFFSAENWFLEASRHQLPSCTIIKRSEIKATFFFPLDVKMFEDNIAFIKYALEHPMIGHVNKCTVLYRVWQGSATIDYIHRSKGPYTIETTASKLHLALYVQPHSAEEIRLYVKHFAYYNWWSRLRNMSMKPWIKEMKYRKPVTGNFLTLWLITFAYLSELLCRIMGKPVYMRFKAVTKKMHKKAQEQRIILDSIN